MLREHEKNRCERRKRERGGVQRGCHHTKDQKERLISMLLKDGGSRRRRLRNQERLLSADARSASADNRRKTTANAAGVSAPGCDEGAIIQRITLS